MKCPQKQPSLGISVREFARRDGCSEKLVRRHVERGGITKLPDGSLDPACVGTGWRESARRQMTDADIAADTSAKMETVRTELSAAVIPVEAQTFALAADSWAVDLALILLRRGMPRADAQAIVEAWLVAARRAGLEALEDVPPPPGCRSWARNRLFTAPWPGQCATWEELVAEAGLA
jgi:hypothetical protein